MSSPVVLMVTAVLVAHFAFSTLSDTPAVRAAQSTCDDLAAHPDDDDKPAGVRGVADEAIAPRAIPVCEQAVQATPKNGRLHFQLGRAYWAAKRHADAVDAFVSAEELGYAPAYFYLAEAYDYGHVEGEKPDAKLATALYALAAEGGFLPAIAMLGHNNAATFDPQAFVRPSFMRALHDGKLDALRQANSYHVTVYLASMYALFGEKPNEYDPSCPDRIDPSVRFALGRAEGQEEIAFNLGNLLDGGRNIVPLAKAVEAARQDGVDDAYLLVSEFGGCSGAAFEKVHAGLKSYVMPPTVREDLVRPPAPTLPESWKPVFGEWRGTLADGTKREMVLFLNSAVPGRAFARAGTLNSELSVRLTGGPADITFPSESKITFEGRLSADAKTIDGDLTVWYWTPKTVSVRLIKVER